MNFRLLSGNDYTEYMKLVNEFRPSHITPEEFKIILSKTKTNSDVWVVTHPENNQIIGTGTIIYEHKFINNGGIVAHIEDIIIGKNYQNMGAGSSLVDFLKKEANERKCYKVILNCEEKYEKFYKKNGFSKHNSEMQIRF